MDKNQQKAQAQQAQRAGIDARTGRRSTVGQDGQMGIGQVQGRRLQQTLPKAEPPPHTINVVQEGRPQPIIPKTVGPAGSFVEQNNPPKDLTFIPGVDAKRAAATAQAGNAQVHGSDDPNAQNLPQNSPANAPQPIEEKENNPNPVLPGQTPSQEQSDESQRQQDDMRRQSPGAVPSQTGNDGRTVSAPQATPRGNDEPKNP